MFSRKLGLPLKLSKELFSCHTKHAQWNQEKKDQEKKTPTTLKFFFCAIILKNGFNNWEHKNRSIEQHATVVEETALTPILMHIRTDMNVTYLL